MASKTPNQAWNPRKERYDIKLFEELAERYKRRDIREQAMERLEQSDHGRKALRQVLELLDEEGLLELEEQDQQDVVTVLQTRWADKKSKEKLDAGYGINGPVHELESGCW